MIFAHLNISKKEIKKYKVRKLRRTYVCGILKTIENQNMLKYGHSYIRSAVYEEMQNRCILMSIGDYEKGFDLILGKVFNKMLKIYKKRNCDHMSFYHIQKFDFLQAMFFRNQIPEC